MECFLICEHQIDPATTGPLLPFFDDKEMIIRRNVIFVKLGEEAEAFDLLNSFIKLIHCPGCFQHQNFLGLKPCGRALKAKPFVFQCLGQLINSWPKSLELLLRSPWGWATSTPTFLGFCCLGGFGEKQ